MKTTLLFLTAAIVPAAWGAPLVCSIVGPDVPLGISQLFVENGVSMTAYGFDEATSTPLDLYKQNDLYENNAPSEESDVRDEFKLGFLGTVDHELELNRYIHLDLRNLWTADPADSQASIDGAPPDEGEQPIGSSASPPAGVEIQSASLNSTADNLTSSADSYAYDSGYSSAPASPEDVEPSTVSDSNAMTWELGTALAASALIGLWLFLRAALLTWRPPARPIRPVRHVRA
jgi:hypothetical protein